MTRECIVCGKTFEATSYNNTLCSDECKAEHKRRMSRKRHSELLSHGIKRERKKKIKSRACTSIEDEARLRGVPYSVVQKERTLAMLGGM